MELRLSAPPARSLSQIDEADTRVPIARVFGLIGARTPAEDDGRSRKIHCPFGDIYHSDHGLSPAMRIYAETNSCYCFSCARRYTPTQLAARAWDVHRRVAAARLLERSGIVVRRPTWAEVCAPPELAVPDRTLLADALKTWCRRTVPGFGLRQFDPDIASLLTRCLVLLDHVRSQDDAVTWLNGCKNAFKVDIASHDSVC